MNAGYVPSGYGEKSGVMLRFGRGVSPLPCPPPGEDGGGIRFLQVPEKRMVCLLPGRIQSKSPTTMQERELPGGGG